MRCARTLAIALCALMLTTGCGLFGDKKAVRKPAAKPAATAAAKGARPAAPDRRETAADAPQGRYAEALRLLKANQLQAAEAALVKAVAEKPQQSGPRTNLGIVYARTNRKAEAAAEFGKAVAANPTNAVAHNWLGVLAREAGDLKRAEQAYRQALAADPTYAPAQLNLAILYDVYMKRPADALAGYRKYEELTARKDARAAVWIAELQAQAAAPSAAPAVPATAAPKPATPGPQPAPRTTGTKS